MVIHRFQHKRRVYHVYPPLVLRQCYDPEHDLWMCKDVELGLVALAESPESLREAVQDQLGESYRLYVEDKVVVSPYAEALGGRIARARKNRK